MKTPKEAFIESLQDCRILEARVQNRDPGPAERLTQANQILHRQITELESALFSVLSTENGILERNAEQSRLDIVRKQSLEFLKTLKVDPKLWQDLASS